MSLAVLIHNTLSLSAAMDFHGCFAAFMVVTRGSMSGDHMCGQFFA
jgi:hypothetical protein